MDLWCYVFLRIELVILSCLSRWFLISPSVVVLQLVDLERLAFKHLRFRRSLFIIFFVVPQDLLMKTDIFSESLYFELHFDTRFALLRRFFHFLPLMRTKSSTKISDMPPFNFYQIPIVTPPLAPERITKIIWINSLQ